MPIIDLRYDVSVMNFPPLMGQKGHLTIWFHESDGKRVMEIPTVYVPPAKRRSGSGGKLLDKAIEVARQGGAESIRLITSPRLYYFINLIKKRGFAHVSSRQPGRVGERWIFEKSLLTIDN